MLSWLEQLSKNQESFDSVKKLWTIKREPSDSFQEPLSMKQEQSYSFENLQIKQKPCDLFENVLQIKQEPSDSFENVLQIKQESYDSFENVMQIKQKPYDSFENVLQIKQEPSDSLENVLQIRHQKPTGSLQNQVYECATCKNVYFEQSKFVNHKKSHKKKKGNLPLKKQIKIKNRKPSDSFENQLSRNQKLFDSIKNQFSRNQKPFNSFQNQVDESVTCKNVCFEQSKFVNHKKSQKKKKDNLSLKKQIEMKYQRPSDSSETQMSEIKNIFNSCENQLLANKKICDSVEKPTYKCAICGKIYTVRSTFVNHTNNHRRKKKTGHHPFKKLELIDTEKNVPKTSMPQRKESFECKICDKVFTKKKTYINHKYNHNKRYKIASDPSVFIKLYRRRSRGRRYFEYQ